MNLAFCFNVKHTSPSKNITAQKEADYDSPETIAAIKNALESGGHEVWQVEANENAYMHFFRNRRSIPIVFNIAEGLGGEAREAHIPAMLEMLRIPYTHSGPLAQAISLDKVLTKTVLLQHDIPTPRFQLVKRINDELDTTLRFPLIAKPNSEGSSIGIFNENLVYDKLKLFERIKWLLNRYKEPVLVEEYIDGREFTVSVLGNDPPKVLPIVEQNFSIFPENMPHIASYEAKWFFEDSLPDVKSAYFCPAQISQTLKSAIERLSLKIYSVLDCKDVIRVDFRVDKKENIYCLEINTLPGMLADSNVVSYLPIAARTAGFSYEGLINTILNEAVARYGLVQEKKMYQILRNYWPQAFLRAR